MKKIPLYLIIMVPLMIAVAVFGVIFGVKLIGVNQIYTLKSFQLDEVEDIPAAEKVTTYTVEKEQVKYDKKTTDIPKDQVVATYEHEGITFISVSENWKYSGLRDICEEMLLNKHGKELEALDEVLVFDYSYDEYLDTYSLDEGINYIPIRLFKMTPLDFNCPIAYEKNIVRILDGDLYEDINSFAKTISESYGEYFMDYHFNIWADEDELIHSPYFKLRYYNGSNILYTNKDYNVSDTQYDANTIWYLHKIAIYDYMYLFGSPTIKTSYDYFDALELLRLSKYGEDEEWDDYYYNMNYYEFNTYPHINVAIPLPDQVVGLPELLYDTINSSVPIGKYDTEKASELNLEVKMQSQYGKKFSVATWDKPWQSENVIYTLVGYDENDEFLGTIKTTDGTERSRAIFGGAVLDTSSTTYTFYSSDYWSDLGFVRLRLIVTFNDGTAIVSPAVDWSF